LVGDVLVGRGARRNAWFFEQAAAVAGGAAPRAINRAESLERLRDIVAEFFAVAVSA
jgi:hypothetical protein